METRDLIASFSIVAVKGVEFPHLEFPVWGVVRAGPRHRAVAVHTDAQVSWKDSPFGEDGVVAVAPAVWRALGLHRATWLPMVELELPAIKRCRVLAARIDDLPGPQSLQVSGAVRDGLDGRRWAVATAHGAAVPVQLHCRTMDHDEDARASHALRLLLGRGEDLPHVQLSSFPRTPFLLRLTDAGRISRRTRQGAAAVAVTVASCLLLLLRVADLGLEAILRGAFRSPALSVITTRAHAGDDALDIVRLHPSAFPMLAIKPGAQIVVAWGPRRTVAIALEDHRTHEVPAASLEARASRVEHVSADLPAEFPPHIVVRVSARVRRNVGAPAATAVQLRRRVRPLLISNLNQLVLPVLGLALAAAALNRPHWGWLSVGFAALVVLSLAGLRHPRPPKGPWP